MLWRSGSSFTTVSFAPGAAGWATWVRAPAAPRWLDGSVPWQRATTAGGEAPAALRVCFPLGRLAPRPLATGARAVLEDLAHRGLRPAGGGGLLLRRRL